LSGGCGSSSLIGVNFSEVSADLDNVSLFGEVLGDDSRVSGEDIDGDLISLDAGNDLVSCGEFSNVYRTQQGDSMTPSLMESPMLGTCWTATQIQITLSDYLI